MLPKSGKKYQLFRSLFKERIYLHYFLGMLQGENLWRMFAALGQPLYYSTLYTIPRPNKSTKCSSSSVIWAVTDVNCYNNIND